MKGFIHCVYSPDTLDSPVSPSYKYIPVLATHGDPDPERFLE